MEKFDIVIAGGGYVGMSTALSIKLAAPHLSILLVDPAPPLSKRKMLDLRASAIALAAQKMLDQLGVWDTLKEQAQPINDMIVTDSKTGDAVRPVYLTFDQKVEDDQPFAHMVPNGAMVAALEERAQVLGVDIRYHESVVDFEERPASMQMTLKSGNDVEANLLIAADGVKSGLRSIAGIKTIHWDYGQSGIVTTVAHEKPHEGLSLIHISSPRDRG